MIFGEIYLNEGILLEIKTRYSSKSMILIYTVLIKK